jgi:hypothetical protein
MRYSNADDILVCDWGDSYRNPPRRCDCGSPIARTSKLPCCHVCHGKSCDLQMRDATFTGNRPRHHKGKKR